MLNRKLAFTGVIAALSYVLFTFVKIPMPGGVTAVHLGNAVCVLGALLLGGFYGGLGAALGMTVADLTGSYAMFAPTTFVLKFLIGLITGVIAHKAGRINEQGNPKSVLAWTVSAAAAGLLFNMVMAPLVNYYYQVLILGKAAADITLSWNILTSVINAVISGAVSVPAYLALRPVMLKAGYFSINHQ